MAASIPKTLSFFIFKHASTKNVRFCISPVSLSTSLHFFSTQTPTHLDINSNPTVFDILVHKHDFPRDFASMVASKLSHVKNPETVDSMLTFFKSSRFSNAHLQKILNYMPRCLRFSLEDNIKPKIKIFQDQGFSSAEISKVFSSSPRILGMSLNNNIIPTLSVLKGLLGSNSAVISVVRKYPHLVTSNTERTVVANVEFLKTCGLSMDRIRIILKYSPRALCVRSEVVRASAKKAKQMGLTASSNSFVYAIPTIASITNKSFELKFQAFRDMGYSESDISSMFQKEPRAFAVSNEKMKKITEGLVATGKFDISSIAHHPVSLMYSFEKRYEPQMRILSILENKNIIENWPTLQALGNLSDAVFFKRFISPYLDHLSDVSISKLR